MIDFSLLQFKQSKNIIIIITLLDLVLLFLEHVSQPFFGSRHPYLEMKIFGGICNRYKGSWNSNNWWRPWHKLIAP